MSILPIRPCFSPHLNTGAVKTRPSFDVWAKKTKEKKERERKEECGIIVHHGGLVRDISRGVKEFFAPGKIRSEH